MTDLWTAEEIAAATGGAVHGGFSVTGVAFDSREIGQGDLFIAMKGEATDGHLFLDKAFAAGELAALTRLVRPHVAIVTAIAPAHRAFFASDEAIADAKSEIFEGLEGGGTALVPFDSPHRDRLAAAARRHAGTVWTFGLGEGADIRAREVVPVQGGTLITATLPDAELTYTLSQPGEHWVSNSLAVIGAVDALGGDLAAAGLALADMAGLKGRGERQRIAVRGGEALLIDESYNANPASMRATLKSLGAEKIRGRRIAVLGAM